MLSKKALTTCTGFSVAVTLRSVQTSKYPTEDVKIMVYSPGSLSNHKKNSLQKTAYDSLIRKATGLSLIGDNVHTRPKHQCAARRTWVRDRPPLATARVLRALPRMFSAAALAGHQPRRWLQCRQALASLSRGGSSIKLPPGLQLPAHHSDYKGRVTPQVHVALWLPGHTLLPSGHEWTVLWP